ncbi:MAG: GGDEF domain-containing protein [Pseudomonadota bacterium]|nr:GGDEF domain-containing protein [Pseudomonadota bacterium]
MSSLTRLAIAVLLLSLATAGWTRVLPVNSDEDLATAVKLSLVQVHRGAGAGNDAATLLNGRLLIEGGTAQQRAAELQFEVPEATDQRWVLWMARDPLALVRVSGENVATQTSGFFAPSAREGPMPSGFAFALPRQALGQQRLRLELEGSVRAAPTPRILSEQQVMQVASREAATACAVYASFLTLLIASFALYAAVRDPIFLLYSAYLTMALLFVATISGLLYSLPGGRWFGSLGARGFWLVVLAFNAVTLLAVMRFANTRASCSAWIRQLDRVALAMGVLPLVALVPFAPVTDSLQSITTAACGLALVAGIMATVDGARRGVRLAVVATVALLLLLLAACGYQAMQLGWLDDDALVRHGYQFVLLLVSIVLFAGGISRIGHVRERLDEETRARVQGDKDLHQERACAGFAQELHQQLRSAGEHDVAPAAFRLLGEHARLLTGAKEVVVMAGDYLGHETLLVNLDGQAARFAQEIRIARQVIRAHAYNNEPVHVRLQGANESDAPERPLRAIIPIRLAAPAWAALVVPVGGPRGLEHGAQEALAALARVAVMHAEQAYAALQLRRTAEHDSLTGTQNRRSLDEALSREFKMHEACDAALAVLFIDIDWFKRINDKRGHACGDFCIRNIAACLQGELRPTDAMGRYGGDEFLVLLPGREAPAARIIAERLRNAVEASLASWEGEPLSLSVSIGLATRREADVAPASLLERADKALYAAKQAGRNRVCVAPSVD